MLYLVELWEELGDKYYLISPINDLAVRVSFAERRQEYRVCPDSEGLEGRSGVCSLFDVTVFFGSHMKVEALSAVSSAPGHTESVPGELWLMPSLVQKRR